MDAAFSISCFLSDSLNGTEFWAKITADEDEEERQLYNYLWWSLCTNWQFDTLQHVKDLVPIAGIKDSNFCCCCYYCYYYLLK